MNKKIETKVCLDCSKEKWVKQFYRRKKEKGYLSYCIPCFVKRSNLNQKEYRIEYGKSSRGHYTFYKSHAKQRELSFELTFEQFKLFKGKHCVYCGDVLQRVGIDRVDNNIGYVLSNCVPCCTVCNRMKRNYTLNDFMKKVEQIYMHGITEKMKVSSVTNALLRVI